MLIHENYIYAAIDEYEYDFDTEVAKLEKLLMSTLAASVRAEKHMQGITRDVRTAVQSRLDKLSKQVEPEFAQEVWNEVQDSMKTFFRYIMSEIPKGIKVR